MPIEELTEETGFDDYADDADYVTIDDCNKDWNIISTGSRVELDYFSIGVLEGCE